MGTFVEAMFGESLSETRRFQRYPIKGLSAVIEAMVYGEPFGARPSIFILNSHEFFMPPSQKFCETAWDAGFQTIFVRRPGIGGSTALPEVLTEVKNVRSGAAVAAEAAMLSRFIDEYAADVAVLLSLGGSNPVAYRLSHFCKRITLFVFANPAFNQNVWGSFSPVWFRGILKQVMASKSGGHMSSLGIKHLMRRDPISFYRKVLSRSAGDLDYINENESDFIVAGELAQSVSPAQFFYELNTNLQLDPMLKFGCFDGRRILVVSGTEATKSWREGLSEECRRLNVPLEFLSSGFIFGPYHAPHDFFEMVIRSLSNFSNSYGRIEAAN